MKRVYMKPAMRAVKIQQSSLICASDWDVINPDQPNLPAGAKDYNSSDDDNHSIWDEEW